MTTLRDRQVCSVCGQGGYWVGFDASTGEDRCASHVGVAADAEGAET